MNHFIAMNPQRGGNKGSASCLPLAEYDKLIARECKLNCVKLQ